MDEINLRRLLAEEKAEVESRFRNLLLAERLRQNCS